jgi:phage anti-repressor protein
LDLLVLGVVVDMAEEKLIAERNERVQLLHRDWFILVEPSCKSPPQIDVVLFEKT